MTQKVLGAAIILAAIFGIIFAAKFVPAYMNNVELDDAFQECISYFEQYKAKGCREYFAKIIEENDIPLDPGSIQIDAELLREGSFVKAEYTQKFNFFNIWTYEHTFKPYAEGKPPRRT